MERLIRYTKNLSWLVIVLCLYHSVNNAYSQPLRDNLKTFYTSQIGVREKTGNNDGVQVEKYLSCVGLSKGYPWCAAFVAYSHINTGIKAPKSAYSPDWFKTNVVYKRDWRKQNPQIKPGMVFGLYFQSKNRVAHVGFINGQDSNNYYTIEGNTNKAGSREGDGVYRKIRPKTSIYIISDYCY